jgi:hypothetical protein
MFLIWWAAGLVVSLLIGGWATRKSLNCIRKRIKQKAEEIEEISNDRYKEFLALSIFPLGLRVPLNVYSSRYLWLSMFMVRQPQ